MTVVYEEEHVTPATLQTYPSRQAQEMHVELGEGDAVLEICHVQLWLLLLQLWFRVQKMSVVLREGDAVLERPYEAVM